MQRESAQPRRWDQDPASRNHRRLFDELQNALSIERYACLALGGKGICVSEGIGDLEGIACLLGTRGAMMLSGKR